MLGLLNLWAWRLGIALVCVPFLVSATTKFFDRSLALDEMAAGGFPRSGVLLWTIVLYQLAGILLILGNLAPTVGAMLLAGFLVVATLAYHQFWRERGPSRIAKLNHFAENFGLVGALCLIAVNG